VLNHRDELAKLDLGDQAGRDLLTGKMISGQVGIPGRGVMIIRKGG
jgi:hypothetical protein